MAGGPRWRHCGVARAADDGDTQETLVASRVLVR